MSLLTQFRSGAGVTLVLSRDQDQQLIDMINELPEGTLIYSIAAPKGPLQEVIFDKGKLTYLPIQGQEGLAAGYKWVSDGPGRVLVIYDLHMIINNPGVWRALSEILPFVRSPKNSGMNDPASLIVAVAPCWDLSPQNPLQGQIPLIRHSLPTREALKIIAEGLAPLNGGMEEVADALCGLTAATAEQAAAECLEANHGKWDADHLRQSRRQIFKENGLEILSPVKWDDIAGLSGWKKILKERVIPFIRDPNLGIHCILSTGLPGLGKTYGARGLGSLLKTEVIALDLGSAKAAGGGIVGMAIASFERRIQCLLEFGRESSLIVLLDEAEKIASEGLDSGTSSEMHSKLLKFLQDVKENSRILVVANVNRVAKLSSELEDRFQLKFWYDLPTTSEREAVAKCHYARLGVEEAELNWISESTAKRTEGFVSREIAEAVCPNVIAHSIYHKEKITPALIEKICKEITPTSSVMAEDFAQMRKAAISYRRANDPPDTNEGATRKIMRK